jgi:hypothetical protein
VGWNRNEETGFQRAIDALWSSLQMADYAVARYLCPMDRMLSAADREALVAASQNKTLELLDNYVNRGDDGGGRLWHYLERLSSRPAPLAPPGRNGDPLLASLSTDSDGKPGRMKRKYRFDEGFVDPLYLVKAARWTLHYRFERDGRRAAARLVAGQGGEVESLEQDDPLPPTEPTSRDEVPGPALSKAHAISMARSAAEQLAHAQARRREGSIHARFLSETRRFIRYVLHQCAEATEPTPFAAWRDPYEGRSDDDVLGDLLRDFDLERWRELSIPGWVAAGLIPPGDEPPDREPLHDQWRAACMALSERRDGIDQAKSRSETDGELDAFYVMLGHCPGYRGGGRPGAPCQRVKSRYRQLFEGGITSQEAQLTRLHFTKCADCFWEFHEYSDDRLAWGYRPQPLVAALRERVTALREAPLVLQVGQLPADLVAFAERAFRVAEEFAAYDMRPRSVGKARRPGAAGGMIFEKRARRAEEAPCAAAPSQPPPATQATVIDADGLRKRTVGIEIVRREWDPVSRSGSITVRVPEDEPSRIVVGRPGFDRDDYSIGAELADGQAELLVADLPPDLGELDIVRWYLVE